MMTDYAIESLPPCRTVVVGIVLVLRPLLKHMCQLLGGFCAFFLALWGIS